MNNTNARIHPPELISLTQHLRPVPSAVHKPFSWLPPRCEHDQAAQFVALTMDVCQGIQTCLELVHSDDMNRRINEDADPGEGMQHTLDRGDTERLLRLATASASLLAGAAEMRIQRMADLQK